MQNPLKIQQQRFRALTWRDAGATIPCITNMKNELAIVTGVLMILAASFIAAGTSSQDHAPRPHLAQVMATALHVTPSTTPRPTFTPIPTATPLHITRLDPSRQDILNLLFQYSYRGAHIITSPSNLSVQRLDLDAHAPILIITGGSAEATDGLQVYPAAFGAVLAWEDSEYVVKFKHVEFGHLDALVSVSVSQSDRFNFVFQDIFIGAREMGGGFQRTIVLQSCKVPLGLAELRELGRPQQGAIEWQCF
jgi:hypothetical protein